VKGRYRKRLKELGISLQEEKILYYWLGDLAEGMDGKIHPFEKA
jgi:hypothetical protein